jgi:MFS family permease
MYQMIEGLNVNLCSASLAVVVSSSFVFGWNQGVLNQPQPFILDFFNTTFTHRKHDGRYPTQIQLTVTWAILNALYVVGLIFGCFTGGVCADKHGRKNTLLFSQVGLMHATYHSVFFFAKFV